ncbi:response regulator [Limnobacter sp.]|uniref:response regulator n=1 Tax=Limnobacter sp. TaxID=2003368 RepID=UPI00351875A6
MNNADKDPSTSAPIRVFVVDDDEQIQQALKRAIETHNELHWLGSAGTLQDALHALASTSPDVVLVDLGLPDGSGLELIAHIHQHLPNCESMVLTVFGDESHVISSIEAGATGYLTKDTRTAEILERLKQLRAGGSPISPVIARRLLKRFRQTTNALNTPLPPKPELDGKYPALSERELEVLEMVAKGFMQAEIAELLGVSVNTVSTYIKRIYRKLAVNSRTGAVHRASALGLISLRDSQ